MSIEEIRARAEAATPGPWFNWDNWMIHSETDVERNGVPNNKVIGTVREANAEFIAHAREDIPALIAEIDRLNKGHEASEQQLADKADEICKMLDEISALTSRAERAEEELKAAVEDIPHYCSTCNKNCQLPCAGFGFCPDWQWRGKEAANG